MTEQTALMIPTSGALARVGRPDEREYLIKIMAETLGIPAKDALRPDVIALLGMAAQQAMTYGALPGIHIHVQKFEKAESKEARKRDAKMQPEYNYTLVQGEKLYKDSGARWRIQYGVRWTYQRKAMTQEELREQVKLMGFSGTLSTIAFGMWSRVIMVDVDDRNDPDNPIWSSGIFLGKRKVGNNWYDEDLPTGVSSRDVAIRRADKRAMMQSSLTLLPLDSLLPEERLERLTDHLRSEGSAYRGSINDIVARPDSYEIEQDGDVVWAKEETRPRLTDDVDFYGDSESSDETPAPEKSDARPDAQRVRTETIGDIQVQWNPARDPAPTPADARPANNVDGPCPDCHAPAGKPHASKCPRRQAPAPEKVDARPEETTVTVDADGVIESEMDVYASILHNPDVDLTPDFASQIIEFQELHKASTAPISEAQYKLLRMLFQSIMSGEEDEHKMFLSCICGTPIDHTRRPGNKLSNIITWLKSPNKYIDEIELINEITRLCREIRKELSTA